ncbi:MAG: hypothetical protein HY040_22210 [Planctomycetes bacterium]|nr:hypothetical protein [Planctomycetota bacterium]
MKLFRKLITSRFNRPARKSHRWRPGIEALEDRAMPSTAPILYSTITEAADFGNTRATAQTIPLAAMMETQVQGKLAGSTDVDMLRIALTAGQVFTTDVSGSLVTRGSLGLPFTTARATLSLQNGAGVPQTVQLANYGQSLEYRVTSPGIYFLAVSWTGTASTQSINYTAHLRAVGLDNFNLDSTLLNRTDGAMTAWQNGNVLNIAGPTGHGFGIRGNWAETPTTANALTSASYRATGDIYLQTAAGDVLIHLPSDLTLTTKPQLWGDAFGEVNSIDWTAPPSLAAYEAILGVIYPPGLLDIGQISAGTKINIGLGRDMALKNTGAPLNNEIPYLYLSVNPLANSSAGSITQAFSAVLDPADPFLYIGSPLSGDTTYVTALAGSAHGIIPFTPVDAPSQWHGNLRGHVYIQSQFDLTALTGVPSELDGNITLNLDPNHTGQVLGNPSLSLQPLLDGLTNPQALSAYGQAIDTIFSNFSAGVNGTLKLSPWKKIADVPGLASRFGGKLSVVDWLMTNNAPKLALGNASLIYDGTTENAYFRGGTANPFAGTQLAPFTAPVNTIDLDAAFAKGGHFYVDFQGGYQPFGFSTVGEIKVLGNWPVPVITMFPGLNGLPSPVVTMVNQTSVTVDLSMNVLGLASEDLKGQVYSNGDFVLSAVDHADLGPFSGSETYTLTYSHLNGFTFRADLAGSASNGPAEGDVTATVYINVNSAGHMTFSGGGSATAYVYGVNVGSVGVYVNNNELVFWAGGYEIDIPL